MQADWPATSMLWVDDQLLIDDYGLHARTPLDAGSRTFRVRHCNGGGSVTLLPG